jgi:hypothetical protein
VKLAKMPVLCVAVIGADNSPVYLRTRTWVEGQNSEVPPEDIHLLYVLHSSLDTIEERLTQSGQSRDTYLGLLSQSETYRVFGLVTATRVKLLVLVTASAPYTVRFVLLLGLLL